MSDILLNTIPEAIEDLKNGKIIIVVDDEDRENEGDFLSAAELTTPETVSYTHLDVYKRQGIVMEDFIFGKLKSVAETTCTFCCENILAPKTNKNTIKNFRIFTFCMKRKFHQNFDITFKIFSFNETFGNIRPWFSARKTE